jgi:murein DD-endopeptidase MepM/ murein hydrolase activator NlpD
MVIVLLVSLMSLGVGFAGNNQDKLNTLNSQIKKLEKQLKAGKTQEKNLNSQIGNLDKLIKEAEGEIQGIQSEISVTNDKISSVQTQLQAMQADIDRQNQDMSKRIRAMYKNGDVGILEVLLGSETITDFMTNLDMAGKIFDNDVQVLEQLEKQHKILDQHRKDLEKLQTQLESKKQEKASKQNELAVNRGNVSQLKAEVSQDNKSIEAQVDALNREANSITAEILRLQSKGGTYSGGQMAWPVPASTSISSKFGNRLHPILNVNKLHTGIDIRVGTGNNIVAANAGKVIKAAWNNSYGYMVMIDHGGGIVTLYAHNSSLRVSAGDTVSRGQVIALSGSTGVSTGPHLHFEVRVNGKYKNPLSYL